MKNICQGISRYGTDRCYIVIRRHGGLETFYYENMKDLRFHEAALDDVADELPYELVEIFDATEVIGG